MRTATYNTPQSKASDSLSLPNRSTLDTASSIIQQLKDNSFFAVCHCFPITCLCEPHVSPPDEIHSWCDPGPPDRLFNHPSPAFEPFSRDKDRQQPELFPWHVAWVTLWYALALLHYNVWYENCYLKQPSVHNVLDFGCGWKLLKCLSSPFLSFSTGTRRLQ